MTRTQRLLTVAAACILGGLVLLFTCGGIAKASGIRLSEQYGKMNEVTHENTGTQRHELDNISDLDIGLIAESVTIRRGGEKVVIEWSQSYDQQYEYKVSGSQVSLKRDEHLIQSGVPFISDGVRVNASGFLEVIDFLLHWDDFGTSFDNGADQPVTVTIPEGMALNSMDISTVNGQVTFEGLEIDSLDYGGVDTGFVLKDCKIDRLVIANVSGNVRLTDCDVSGIDMGTVSGRLDITGGRCERLELSGVNAELDYDKAAGLNRAEVSGLNVQASMTLPGSREDYRLSADGLNAELIVAGRYESDRSEGSGSSDIIVAGLNAILRVDFDE